MQTAYEFRQPQLIVFGNGVLQKTGDLVRQLGADRAVVVTDPGVAKAGLSRRVVEALQQSGIQVNVFSEVEAEPSLENAELCFQSVKGTGLHAVVGVGGGSAIDVGKAVSLLAGCGGSLRDYLGVDLVPRRGLPMIMIPTTAGTGSEVTPNAIFADKSANLKKGVVSRHIVPDVAVVDPELTVTAPPFVTATSGMDALTHAIESYTAKKANAQTDIYAIEAVRLIGSALRAAYANGSSLEARTSMAQGSLFAGIPLANAGVGGVHALAYPLGGTFGVPHGLANAVLLPYVMRFNLTGAVGKFAIIGTALGAKTDGLTGLQAAEAAVTAVEALSADVGIPRTLAGFGVTEADCDRMAPGAVSAARLVSNNPRELTERDAALIYRHALFGTVW